MATGVAADILVVEGVDTGVSVAVLAGIEEDLEDPRVMQCLC